ncbi:MAG: HEAT repeat protein [Myxococcota bacterium]
MKGTIPLVMIRVVVVAAAVSLLGCEKSATPKAKEASEPKPSAGAAPEAPKAAPETKPVVEKPEPKAPKPGNLRARPDADYPLIAFKDITDDPDVLAAIETLRESGKEKSKRKALEALRAKGSVKALLKAMRAPNPNVRSMSALILNRMKHNSKAYTAQLSAMILTDADADVRGMAGRVMVYYRNKGNVAALSEALEKDGSEAVRMHAAWALGASHDRRGVPALLGALDDESTDVRLRTVGALKRIKSKRAIAHLVGRLDDSNAMVKKRAHEAITALSGKDLGRSVDGWRRAYPEPKKK